MSSERFCRGEPKALPTDELFRLYQDGKPVELRNELVERHLHLAEYHVRRYASGGVTREDIRQVASLALVLAVQRFEPSRGLAFSTFASCTIDGECKRHLRDRTWAVRPPRHIQELHLSARRAQEQLTHRNGRPPTVEELATELDVSVELVLEALEASHSRYVLSVDRPVASGGSVAETLFETVDPMATADARLVVQELVAALDPRERWILQERFFRHRGQPEIAAQLGISQSYLSRVINRILARLRRELDGGHQSVIDSNGSARA